MKDFLHGVLLRIYRRFPTGARRGVVRAISPSFTVGAMCFLERDDGALLLLRHSYRHRWGVPGGLLEKGEAPADAVVREVLEETSLRVELVGEPAVVVDPEPRRVDVVFRARLASRSDADPVPSSPEIVEVRWFAAGELPELQHETSQALVALARSASSPQARPIAAQGIIPFPRSDAV